MTTAEARIRGSERREIEQDLSKIVTGEVKFDPFSRVLYSTDASIYQMEPIGVVIPKIPMMFKRLFNIVVIIISLYCPELEAQV